MSWAGLPSSTPEDQWLHCVVPAAPAATGHQQGLSEGRPDPNRGCEQPERRRPYPAIPQAYRAEPSGPGLRPIHLSTDSAPGQGILPALPSGEYPCLTLQPWAAVLGWVSGPPSRSLPHTHEAMFVGDVVSQLQLVKGHRFGHPLLSGGRAVRVDVHAFGHLWVRLPGHHPSRIMEFIPAIVSGHNVHQQDVFGFLVQTADSNLEGREHPPARKGKAKTWWDPALSLKPLPGHSPAWSFPTGVSPWPLFCPLIAAWETPPVVVTPGESHFCWSDPLLSKGFLGPYAQIW